MLNSKFSLKFRVATPFFTDAPRSFVPSGISVIQFLFVSSSVGPAKSALIAFVNGESVFGNLRFTTFLTIEPSESTTTKYKDAVVVKFSVGFSFGVVTVD